MRVVDKLNQYAGVSMIIMALLLGGTYAVNLHQERERVACQTEYNRVFTVQLHERSRLSAASDDSKTRLLQAMGKALLSKPEKDKKKEAKRVADFLDLFRAYNKEVTQLEKDRAATPLPPIPTC